MTQMKISQIRWEYFHKHRHPCLGQSYDPPPVENGELLLDSWSSYAQVQSEGFQVALQ